MADAAPVVPAVSSFDPVDWTRKINVLEDQKRDLETQVFDLRSKLTQQSNAAASARGSMKSMRDEIEALRAKVAASENLKELAQLRTEVAKAHSSSAVFEKAAQEREMHVKIQLQDLTARAGRAEAKFQALESTTAIMAKSRDKANEAAAALLAERDEAQKNAAALKEDLDQFRAEFVKVKGDLDKAQAELRALRQAPQTPVKAKA